MFMQLNCTHCRPQARIWQIQAKTRSSGLCNQYLVHTSFPYNRFRCNPPQRGCPSMNKGEHPSINHTLYVSYCQRVFTIHYSGESAHFFRPALSFLHTILRMEQFLVIIAPTQENDGVAPAPTPSDGFSFHQPPQDRLVGEQNTDTTSRAQCCIQKCVQSVSQFARSSVRPPVCPPSHSAYFAGRVHRRDCGSFAAFRMCGLTLSTLMTNKFNLN